MTDLTEDNRRADQPVWSTRTLAGAATLAVLVVLADLLFWPHEPGISVAIFFFALNVGIVALHRDKLRARATAILLVVAVLGCLPLVETLSPLGLLSALATSSLLALGISGKLPRFEDWFGAFTRFGVLAPVRLIDDGIRVLGEAGRQKLGGKVVRLGLVWVVPLLCAAVFVWLFTAANPIFEAGLRAIRLDQLLQLLNPWRVVLWGLVAMLAWPLLAPKLLAWTPLAEMQGPVRPRAESLVFGATAIRNSLIVFNALFAVQTAMDLLFLWGGLRLPEGMSHADYAHRGAYPLIVTAVLAGAFVLAAMRRNGPGRTSPLIRTLVYLWIGQNVWLVISSILRLKLYVEAYQLSELRIGSGIWMALVAVGLVLIVFKIVGDRSNKWLVMANTVALAVTLYGVSWLNFPAVISRYNVEHSREVTGEGLPLDFTYMGELGPEVIPALDVFLTTAVFASPETLKSFAIMRDNLADAVIFRDVSAHDYHVFSEDWQSWTWRSDRLRRYLTSQVFAPEPVDGMG